MNPSEASNLESKVNDAITKVIRSQANLPISTTIGIFNVICKVVEQVTIIYKKRKLGDLTSAEKEALALSTAHTVINALLANRLITEEKAAEAKEIAANTNQAIQIIAGVVESWNHGVDAASSCMPCFSKFFCGTKTVTPAPIQEPPPLVLEPVSSPTTTQ